MKAKVFIMEDDESYFEVIKKVLENTSLSFYPNSKKDFYELRQLICRCRPFVTNYPMRKDIKDDLLEILESQTDQETIFLVTCCIGEDDKLEGLAIYEDFTKHRGGKTIIISSAATFEELEKIESFCQKNPGCFLFRKSEESLKNDLIEILLGARSDIYTSPSPVN